MCNLRIFERCGPFGCAFACALLAVLSLPRHPSRVVCVRVSVLRGRVHGRVHGRVRVRVRVIVVDWIPRSGECGSWLLRVLLIVIPPSLRHRPVWYVCGRTGTSTTKT